MEQATRVVPAGWYQDPANAGNVRWWNGITWTDHVEAKPTGEQAAAASALALEARAMERQHGITTAENDIIMSAATGDVPSGHPRTGTIAIAGSPHRMAPTGTASAWLLGLTPLIGLVLTVVAAYVFFYVTPTPLVAAVVVVLYALGFMLAVGDSRTLEARGHHTASPMWALALPVIGPLLYLVNRRLKAPGSKPLIAFLVLLVVAAGIPLAGVATGSAATMTKALEVQQAVRADLVGTGAATSVTCPPILESIAAGTVFTCDAVLPDGNTVHVWVSFDNEQGQFSWALANR
ncbi:MAG: DUF2510 domain-containing protein [Pseudolysinimonas sp.]